jgi:HK97 family phage prohead protease
MPHDIERRFFETGPLTVETRKAKDGETDVSVIRGYAAVFNKYSLNLGGFREQILPGAFDAVLQDDVRALFNHDPNFVLGRTTAGTCRMGVDDTGLFYEVDLPDTQTARDLLTSIARGDVSQSSFAFSVAAGGAEWTSDDLLGDIRNVSKVARLYDVSPVTYPAYPDATIAARSLNDWKASKNNERAAVLKISADIRSRKLKLAEHYV